MPIATLTSKGQVTIPKPVREALGIDAGDEIDFVLAANGSVRLEVRRRDVRELAGSLRTADGKRLARLSLAQMDAAIARHLATPE
jgi:AbrB family looped-hinge helix DNA binding protein